LRLTILALLVAAPVVSKTVAPAGTEGLAVEWMKVQADDVGTLLAAVARPAEGSGPFPTVILLHGSHGFAPEYVKLAKDLAARGVLAVAPCWFSGGGGSGARDVSAPIPCPQAPPTPMPASPEAQRTIDALVQATRMRADVRGDRVFLFGHSRGAGASLHYASGKADVQAAILDSSGFGDPLAELAARVKVPLLILHGEADGSEIPGGSGFTDVRRAREFEAELRRLGKSVEAHYYPGGVHNGIFINPAQHQDEVNRIVSFVMGRIGT